MNNKLCIYPIWKESPPIPEGTQPLKHQVAGHIYGRKNGFKKNKLGFLQNNFGQILKPIQGPLKGKRELNFYKFLFKNEADENSDFYKLNVKEEDLKVLKHFIPLFFGTWSTPLHPEVTYLVLEDVTISFEHPCIMDVKMGRITYDKFASEQKKKREENKSKSLREIGFQVLGIKVFSHKEKEFKSLEREELRTFNKQQIISIGLDQYFSCDISSCSFSPSSPSFSFCSPSSPSFSSSEAKNMQNENSGRKKIKTLLIKEFLNQLVPLEKWFQEQKTFQFIATSLLFIYDSSLFQHLHGNPSTKERSINHENQIYPKLKVKMIDFTHIFPKNKEDFDIDLNYLSSLKDLISTFQLLIS